jgi:hypothetical protein
MAAKNRVELLVNPFCMEEADACEVGKICEELNITLTVYNVWDIDDDELREIPGHVASLIRELRTGQRPGSIYGNLFINGERFHLNLGESRLSGRWREKAREMIATAMREGPDD